jgi:wobble nucleotide-excising tRNase
MDDAYNEILEYQGFYEVELMQNQLLEEQVERLEGVVESKSKVIDDIEVKFTEYLRGYNDNVNSEISVRNEMRSQSATELREYQVELRVAAQDDEGSTMRIEELERRKDLAESVAQRIFDKGMIMSEEYQDQVQSLQGLLGNTEQRIRQRELPVAKFSRPFCGALTVAVFRQPCLGSHFNAFHRRSFCSSSSNGSSSSQQRGFLLVIE